KLEVDQRRDDLNTGVADQNVERAERLDDGGDTRLHLVLGGDVHGDADGALTARVDLPRGGVGRLLIEVGDRNLRPFARADEGDLLADAAGRSRNYGNLILQTHDHSP